MKIAIDASRSIRPQRTGTENYSLHLTRALLQRAAAETAIERRFTLYFNQPPAPGLFLASPEVEARNIPFPRLWTHLRLAAALRRDRPDVLFVPAHVLPFTYRGPSVVTIHDLGYVYYPEAHPRRQLSYLRWATRHNARYASHLFADSAATKADIVRHLGVPHERITVVPLGVDPTLGPVTDGTQLADMRSRYGIPSDYLLFVGTLHPRKNLARLISAYARLWEDGSVRAALVLAGGIGWLPDTIMATIERTNAPLVLTGYVRDEDMAALSSGAQALGFPSLYEGFGLPVLEAMACGTPVIASNTSSLPEVVGDAGILVDPERTDAIAAGIMAVLTTAALRDELRGRGLERARLFTWARASEIALEALDAVGGLGALARGKRQAIG